ncbi:hypothetical protein E3J84_00445 [Candidatus Aerophobetes bacterium]|uniref:Uncharacterized protein n=1 Tax=Aerophobetes bacterium TaxID=2030807 RepID=A0A523S4Z2_UNCAE|nr:MAG: hypothetical protein E3J84_00445 [Candidatus Aerophobetes bacterium]
MLQRTEEQEKLEKKLKKERLTTIKKIAIPLIHGMQNPTSIYRQCQENRLTSGYHKEISLR